MWLKPKVQAEMLMDTQGSLEDRKKNWPTISNNKLNKTTVGWKEEGSIDTEGSMIPLPLADVPRSVQRRNMLQS